MKKILSFIFVFTVLVSVSFCPSFVLVHAEADFEEECDTVFFQTLNEIITDEGITTVNNTIKKEIIYDMHLDPLGYIYYINFEGKKGYAFVINTTGEFEITELYFDAEDPYAKYSGDKVYVNLMLYAVWNGENFIETSKGIVLDSSDNVLNENAFYASDYVFTQSSETVYYTNRVKNEYGIAKRYPGYLPIDITNGCVAAAGGNIIGFYTRFFPELMPGFTPGTAMGDFYFYKELPQESVALIQTLYDYMETNIYGDGTNINNFKNGMIRFCNEKNRNISFYSCMQGGRLNFDKAKQNFALGQPSVLFVDTFTVCTLLDGKTNEKIDYLIAKACHAMAGFGYSEITYTLSNGSTRNDKYIMVATGLPLKHKAYFNINYNTNIDEYYSIDIY